MSKSRENREMAARVYSILVVTGSKLRDFSDLYEVFVGLCTVISTQERAIITLFSEIVEMLPEEVKQELRQIAEKEYPKGTNKQSELSEKPLETLIKEILGDDQKGDEKK